MTNYFWAREYGTGECVWLRAEDIQPAQGVQLGAGVVFPFPRPLVHANGVWDLVHASHMRLLRAAKEKAGRGCLVVTMDSDRMVRQKKGPARPILSWVERAAALAHLGVNFLVEIDSDEEYERTVRGLQPDLLVTGSDKVSAPDRFPEFRSMVVRDHGIRTTEIVRRCVKAEQLER